MKILYAEDEKQMSAAVSEILRMEKFDVYAVYDGNEAWNALQSNYYDAVILDVMMPGLDGFEILEKMRSAGNNTPVLMLTAKAALDDRISGLDSGADDYLGKPFAMKELLSRLQALLRRDGNYQHAVFEAANVCLDMSSGEVRTDAGSLRLNNAEALLLAHFIKNPEHPFTLSELNESIWAGTEGEDKAELYVFYLSNKLKQIRSELYISGNKGCYMLKGLNQ